MCSEHLAESTSRAAALKRLCIFMTVSAVTAKIRTNQRSNAYVIGTIAYMWKCRSCLADQSRLIYMVSFHSYPRLTDRRIVVQCCCSTVTACGILRFVTF